eukprot:gene12227-14159_t
MRAWCIVIALSYLFLQGAFSSLPWGPVKTGLGIRKPGDDESIDKALYSRQLLVYGESAQVKLKQATILMVGRSHLNNEIAKIVALAGVGKILFVEQAEDGEGKAPSLLGNAPSPAHYVADQNRNVEVETIAFDSGDFDWSELLAKHNITVAVATGANFTVLNELDLSCQRAGVKLVACDLHGSCGYIFNNFHRGFKVLDADGEDRKEVVLTNHAEVSHSTSDSEGKSTVLLHLTSIEEEKLNVGIGEHVELLDRKGNVLDEPFEVIQVMDTRNMKIAIPNSERAENLKESIQRDGALFRKIKAASTVNHESLLLQLLRPSFCPSNACLAVKKDRAVSLGLLACFKVRDRLIKGEKNQDSETMNADTSASAETVLTGPALRSLVVSELHTMGILEPELSVKQKGQVGSDVIDSIVSTFFDSSRKTVASQEAPAECGRLQRLPECPASAAVVGAVAAQEVIKAVTHMYTPISQFLMFEGIGVREENVRGPIDSRGKDVGGKRSATAENLKKSPTKQPLHRRLLGKAKDLLKLSKAPISALVKPVLPAASISAPGATTSNMLTQLYGAEVMQELQSLRVFVVGAGAIGSEILKNLALLGVGTGVSDKSDTKPVATKRRGGADSSVKRRDGKQNNTTTAKAPRSRAKKSMWERQGLLQGGIVATDMDKIERSNLNRQLLFREQHIGQCKSLTAAAQVAQLNPALNHRVHGLTLKVGAETEQTFNGAFWAQTDVVITALDNVEAREYVDAMCVKHGRWLLDSGTLGTKGNTQVVIPFLTESYSSSADPAEEAVPLCTLKSFPYQPEHCVAWAKSRFEEYFNSQVELVVHLRSLLLLPTTATTTATDGSDADATATEDRVRAWLNTLSTDQLSGVLKVLRFQPWTSDGARKWAISEFQTMFFEEPSALLRENPAESNDEEGRPFWGGSRRQPSPQEYDASNPLHREFISLVSAQLQRAYLCTSAFTHANDLMPNSDAVRSNSMNEIVVENSTRSEAELVDAILSQLKGSTSDVESLRTVTFQPQQFDKDDAALRHVEVVAAFSNLRSRLYGIKELGQLQVQKVAGNIIPALATTTSLVAGLVTQELIKLAQERVRFKRLAKSAQTETENPAARAATMGEKDLGEVPQNTPLGSTMHTAQRWLRCPRSTPPIPATLTSTTASAVASEKSSLATSDGAAKRLPSRDLPRWYLLQHKERILNRFRNGFVNLARPMLAFAEPVEAEMDNQFTQWDSIEADGSVRSLDVNRLSEQLGYQIDTISWGDTLLYADFLPDQKKLRKMSIRNLMLLALRSVQNEENEAIEEGDSHAGSKGTAKSAEKRLKKLLQNEEFILLDVSVKAKDDAKEEGEVSIPKVKVYVHSLPKL